MIVQKILEEDNTLVKTYSDADFYIRNVETGEIWGEAIDPVFMNRVYEETDQKIEEDEEEPSEPEPIMIGELEE